MNQEDFGCVAVQLSRKMWPGNAKLRAEELGLEEKDIPEIVTLGYKKLYPKHWRDAFMGLYEQARYFLKCHSLPFIAEHIRAVPKNTLPKVIEQLERIQKEYAETLDRFLAQYEAMKAGWRDKYPELWPTMEGFYPSAHELRKKYALEYTIFEIKSATYSATTAAEVQAAYAKAKADLEKRLVDMVEESVTYLRAKVKSTVLNLKTKIESGKTVRADTLGSVQNVYHWFKELNIFGDAGIESDLKKLKEALDGVDGEALKEDANIGKNLCELADALATKADNLEDVSFLVNTHRRRLEK